MVQRGENAEPRAGLPSLPGTYALVLRFSSGLEIVVGRLGVLAVQPGFYVYVGSALGPGRLGCPHRKALPPSENTALAR